ncbi:unnamed protein product [Fraxinus pennsylvanica]|uniref:Retrotransposon Copia-like N-terminal domain-containing protein n=1 Tax=Fraxinus pennsylvanica TaxID=56036 RepID=A0AAD1ZK08_9LAMI|nr:unnamed protein product [Fraxinus pennsylvanica]
MAGNQNVYLLLAELRNDQTIQGNGRQNEMNTSDPLFLHSSDNPGMTLVTAPLTGKIFLAWTRSVKIALGAKMKLWLIDGSVEILEKTSPNYEKWQRVNYMITSWLLNFISKDIVEAFLYTSTVGNLLNHAQQK